MLITNAEFEKLASVEDAIGILEPAFLAYRRAKERGMGYEIPTEMFLEDSHP